MQIYNYKNCNVKYWHYSEKKNRDTLIYVCIGKALQWRLLSEVHITVLRKPHLQNMIQYFSSTSKRGYNRVEIVWLKKKRQHTNTLSFYALLSTVLTVKTALPGVVSARTMTGHFWLPGVRHFFLQEQNTKSINKQEPLGNKSVSDEPILTACIDKGQQWEYNKNTPH